jgi:hypothetical protein
MTVRMRSHFNPGGKITLSELVTRTWAMAGNARLSPSKTIATKVDKPFERVGMCVCINMLFSL